MKLVIFITLIMMTSISFAKDSSLIRPFSTDLCTGYKEGTKENPTQWSHCCRAHDLRLWAGGTRKERRLADKKLRQCVRQTGSPFNANLMWIGIRLGSLSPIKIKGKQWGNAWGNKTRRTALSASEISVLERSLIENSSLSTQEIQTFIHNLEHQ